MSNKYHWTRFADISYEVSSHGDKRFSAFNAKLADGRSIEEHYQCDIKGYDVGGTNWRLGKGKHPLVVVEDLFELYLQLWVEWVKLNPEKIEELRKNAAVKGYLLTDKFATSDINQARALCVILNEGL